MKPEREFRAERPLAQHCAELLGAGAAAKDHGPALLDAGKRMAATLAHAIGRLTGTDAPAVTAQPARTCPMEALASDMPGLGAHSLLAIGDKAVPALATVGADAVLRLFDRAFGGPGHAPNPLPDAFPLSANLFVTRLEDAAVHALHEAMAPLGAPCVRAARRCERLEDLKPFAGQEALTIIDFTVEEPGFDAWTVTLALPTAALDALFPDHDRRARAKSAPQPGLTDAPYGDVPLRLHARIVDMKVPFSRLSDLKPGDVLPVALARTIPLTVRDRTVAHGTVGEMDDRVAIRITKSF